MEGDDADGDRDTAQIIADWREQLAIDEEEARADA
jgi:hypothetical protein